MYTMIFPVLIYTYLMTKLHDFKLLIDSVELKILT